MNNHYFLKAEIDAACELADFFRFNCFFAKELMKYQPISEDPSSVLNLMRYRPLEGFIASVTPFNFTAIAGNLAYTPCIMVTPYFISGGVGWTFGNFLLLNLGKLGKSS